jgi:hypothetical protein
MDFDQPNEPEADRGRLSRARRWLGVQWILQNAILDPRRLDFRKQNYTLHYREAKRAVSNNLCRLQAANWPTAIALAAGVLVLLVLPPNSNVVLLDQSVAAHIRSMTMFDVCKDVAGTYLARRRSVHDRARCSSQST